MPRPPSPLSLRSALRPRPPDAYCPTRRQKRPRRLPARLTRPPAHPQRFARLVQPVAHYETTRHLDRAATLLTAFRIDQGTPTSQQDLARWARELLGDTRMFLDMEAPARHWNVRCSRTWNWCCCRSRAGTWRARLRTAAGARKHGVERHLDPAESRECHRRNVIPGARDNRSGGAWLMEEYR